MVERLAYNDANGQSLSSSWRPFYHGNRQFHGNDEGLVLSVVENELAMPGLGITPVVTEDFIFIKLLGNTKIETTREDFMI